ALSPTIQAYHFKCDIGVVEGSLQPVGTADAAGWIRYEVDLPAMDSAPCLYLTSSLADGESTLIDDAELVPADGTGEPQPASAFVPSPELNARLAKVVDTMRRTTVVGRQQRPRRKVNAR